MVQISKHEVGIIGPTLSRLLVQCSCGSSHVIKLKQSSQLIGRFGHMTASAVNLESMVSGMGCLLPYQAWGVHYHKRHGVCSMNSLEITLCIDALHRDYPLISHG